MHSIADVNDLCSDFFVDVLQNACHVLTKRVARAVTAATDRREDVLAEGNIDEPGAPLQKIRQEAYVHPVLSAAEHVPLDERVARGDARQVAIRSVKWLLAMTAPLPLRSSN